MTDPREIRWENVSNYGNVKERAYNEKTEEGRSKKEYLGSILKDK